MGRPTRRVVRQKPPKPYETFPLFPHQKGYWAKKVEGRQESFGSWAWPDPDAYERSWKEALERYKKFDENLALGITLRMKPGDITLTTLVDLFLTHKQQQAQEKAITARMFQEYRNALAGIPPGPDGKKKPSTTAGFRDFFGGGVRVRDLENDAGAIQLYCREMDKLLGWHAFNKRMTLVRGMFKWASDPMTGVLERPFRLTGLFKKQGEKILRKSKRLREADRGKSVVPPAELRALVRFATQPLKAMILLGYFGAFGNTDCADVPEAAFTFHPDTSLGLPKGYAVVHFPRPKTEIDRAAVLPPFVVETIRDAIAQRPQKCADPRWKSLLFRTVRGLVFVRAAVHLDEEKRITKAVHIDSIATIYAKLRERITSCSAGHVYELDAGDACCLQCREPLVRLRQQGFYVLRHTAITHASGAANIDALTRWQGHSLPGMRRFYVEDVEVHDLKAIADRLVAKFNSSPITQNARFLGSDVAAAESSDPAESLATPA